jgi:hypothetical protein
MSIAARSREVVAGPRGNCIACGRKEEFSMSRWVAFVLSLAIGSVAAWCAYRAGSGDSPISTVGSRPLQAQHEPAPPHNDEDIKLPDDPKAVVLSLGRGVGFMRRATHFECEIRADGALAAMVVGPGPSTPELAEGFLSARELQDLLRYIIREKQFFGIGEDQIQIEPKLRGNVGPFVSHALRVQADGRQHQVVFAFEEGAPSTQEVENLKAILARLETVKAAAIAAGGKSSEPPQGVAVPLDPNTPVIRHGRADANFHRVIYANGSVKVEGKDQIDRALSPRELQDLLHYIVRDQKFFDLWAEHVYFPPGSDPALYRAEVKALRVQADGKHHTVKYDGLEHAPPSAEVERLKKIIARIEHARSLARPKAADEDSR